MKQAVIIFNILFLASICSFAGTKTDPQAKNADKENERLAASMADALLTALTNYKNEHKSHCINKLEGELSFELLKDVTHDVPKDVTVDSLVFGNEQLSRWGYFKTIDLNYIKDVEALVTIKSSLSLMIAQHLANILQEDGLNLIERGSGTLYEFVDQQGGYVIDGRFRKPTESHIQSKYHYKIEVLDDYLILDIKEVVSNNWLTDTSSLDQSASLAKIK